MDKILQINDLNIEFSSARGTICAVDGISLWLHPRETLGIVGESGSGKSVTALSIMRLLPTPPAKFIRGNIWFHPKDQASPIDLTAISDRAIQKIRGKDIAMIFQEPMTSLNPVFSCGNQVAEAIQLHQKVSFAEAKIQTIQLFQRVNLPDPLRIFNAFPHQISGGQKQRVMIAMAMSCQPSVLIADEPTTALDVTVQKKILDLMREWKEASGLSMIFISHDLGVISEICDRVAVMYKGKIVEQGPVRQVLEDPMHPYTKGLVACRPSLHKKMWRMPTVSDFMDGKPFNTRVVTPEDTSVRNTHLYAQEPLLQVKNLSVRFPSKKNWLAQTTGWLNAVDNLSFEVFPGETFGLAGESGCGKTTLGRSIARLTAANSGEVLYRGVDVLSMSNRDFRPIRKEIQVVFQDPYASLNPRMTIGEAIQEPLKVHRLFDTHTQMRAKAINLLEIVGLQADHFNRYPHEFSGGQRQRICIARALSLNPRLLICDEMVSALDVSVQATILNLLKDLQQQFGLTYLFISHDLSVIKQLCDRVMVMNNGKIEAVGFSDELYHNPPTEYVQRLIDSVPGAQFSC